VGLNGSNQLGLRAPDPVTARTVEGVALPDSIWRVLDEAVAEAGLSLAEGIAQIICDRCAPPVSQRSARAPRAPKRTPTSPHA
jgi:hypothetical protein